MKQKKKKFKMWNKLLAFLGMFVMLTRSRKKGKSESDGSADGCRGQDNTADRC